MQPLLALMKPIQKNPLVTGVRRGFSRAVRGNGGSSQATPHTGTRITQVPFVLKPLRMMSAASSTPLPPVLPEPVPPQPLVPRNDGIVQRLWNRFSLTGQQRRIQVAESFFQAASHQANDARWFGPGRIPREFRSRHALITMHVWFLHKRLILDTVDPKYALSIQEELFNILWEDTTCRIRQQGVNELMVNKNLLKVQQYTFLHLTHYDHVFTEFLDKPADRLQELRHLVWEHILVREEGAENRFDQLDRIAWYIEANYQNIIMEWPDEYYRSGRTAWVDLPDFSGLKDSDGILLPDNPIHPDDALPHPWRRNITLKGVTYFWNPDTLESRWDKPQ